MPLPTHKQMDLFGKGAAFPKRGQGLFPSLGNAPHMLQWLESAVTNLQQGSRYKLQAASGSFAVTAKAVQHLNRYHLSGVYF